MPPLLGTPHSCCWPLAAGLCLGAAGASALVAGWLWGGPVAGTKALESWVALLTTILLPLAQAFAAQKALLLQGPFPWAGGLDGPVQVLLHAVGFGPSSQTPASIDSDTTSVSFVSLTTC